MYQAESKNILSIKGLTLTKCSQCGGTFNINNKLPTRQQCSHPFCLECVKACCPYPICSKDGLALDETLNMPYVYLLGRLNQINHYLNQTGDEMENGLINIAELLAESLLIDNGVIIHLSPQMQKKVLNLIQLSTRIEGTEFVVKFRAVFDRLIHELILAHHTTKQRIKDFLSLVRNKGCFVEKTSCQVLVGDIPINLSRFVIEQVICLFQATDFEAPLERRNIIDFVAKELKRIYQISISPNLKKTINKIIQTLYKGECFYIVETEETQPNRLMLKEDCRTFEDMIMRHDIGLIELATAHNIRLDAKSWSWILYDNSDLEDVAKANALLKNYQPTASISELESVINETNDKLNLQNCLNILKAIDLNFINCNANPSRQRLVLVMNDFNRILPLFRIRR